MKLRRLFIYFLTIIIVTSVHHLAISQQTISSNYLNSFLQQISFSRNIVSIIPGKWTAEDWDNAHALDAFTRNLDRLDQHLEELQTLGEETLENPEPSAKGKILSGLKSSSGQLQGLKRLVQEHLVTPTAQEGVLSDLQTLEDTLDESAEMLASDVKK